MSGNSNLYSQGFASTSLGSSGVIPIIEQRVPTSTDIIGPFGPFKIGQQWIDQSAGTIFELVNLKTQGGFLTASWVLIGSGMGGIDQVTTTSGVASPVGGNLNIFGAGGIMTSASGETVTITGSGGSLVYPITQYVVGPVGLAGYQTIQSAITAAATSTSGTGNVYVMPGIYAENLIFSPGVNVIASNLEGLIGSAPSPVAAVQVTGNCTLTTEGTLLVHGVYFNVASGDAITIAPSGSFDSAMAIEHCQVNASSGNGITLNGGSGGAISLLFRSQVQGSASGINTVGPTSLIVDDSQITGGSAAAILMGAGGAQLSNNCIITGGSDAAVNLTDSSSQLNASNCEFNAPSAASILFTGDGTFSSLGNVYNCFNPSGYYVAGTGNYQYGNELLTGSATQIDPSTATNLVLSLSGDVQLNGSQTVSVNTSVNSSDSPYNVDDTDFFLAVDPSGGSVTVNLPTPATNLEGNHLIVADATGSAGTNNITVNGNGANIVYNGTSSGTQTISSNYGALDLTYDGTVWLASAGQASTLPIADFASPPPLGNVTPNQVYSTSLSSTGTTDLGTGAGISVILGNTGIGTQTSLLFGTMGGFINGDGTGTLSIYSNQTSGTINIGGTGSATGEIAIGVGTGAQNIQVGASAIGSTDLILGSQSGSSATHINAGSGGVDVSGNITFSDGQNVNITSVNFAASPYSVLSTDYEIAVDATGGAVTITLPSSPATGRHVVVADVTGHAGTNFITVQGNGNNVNSSSSGTSMTFQTISTAYGTYDLVYNGTEWIGTQNVTTSSSGNFASPPALGNVTPNQVFSTTLSSTGNTTIGSSAGSSSVIGNTGTGSVVDIYFGSLGGTIDGPGTSQLNIYPSQTSGNISMGNSSATGIISILTGNQIQLDIPTGTGEVSIFPSLTSGAVVIGNASATGSVQIKAASVELTGTVDVTGNLDLMTAGNKVSVATGANASIGQSILVGGTVTVSTTAVDSSSLIFLTNAAASVTPGIISVGTITSGTSFVINSSVGTDTSTVNWWIIN